MQVRGEFSHMGCPWAVRAAVRPLRSERERTAAPRASGGGASTRAPRSALRRGMQQSGWGGTENGAVATSIEYSSTSTVYPMTEEVEDAPNRRYTQLVATPSVTQKVRNDRSRALFVNVRRQHSQERTVASLSFVTTDSTHFTWVSTIIWTDNHGLGL